MSRLDGGFSLHQILEWSGGRLVNADRLGSRAGSVRVTRVADLSGSESCDIAYFFSKEFQNALPLAHPGILITGEPFVEPLSRSGLSLWNSAAVVACADPYLTMARLSTHFAKQSGCALFGAHLERPEAKLIHPLAWVAPTAVLGERVVVGPGACVEDGVRMGDGCILYAGAYVGKDVVLGQDCVLFPGARVYERVVIGNRVRLHAGVVIGADGFGYAPEIKDGRLVSHHKIQHFGSVRIGDDVEIGANSCVDRGTLGDTVIEDQAKIDNLVQVGHNVSVGRGTIICGMTGIAGSATLGKNSIIAGMVGVSNRVVVGEGAKVGAGTIVSKDVAPGNTVVGNPQRDHHGHFRAHAALNRLVRPKKKPDKNSG